MSLTNVTEDPSTLSFYAFCISISCKNIQRCTGGTLAYEQQVQDVEAQVESEKERVDGQLHDLRRQVNEGNSRGERVVERVQSQLDDHSSEIEKIKNKVNGRSSEMGAGENENGSPFW